MSFAKAIMTTDTFPKAAYKQTTIRNNKYSIIGICKGSGMIAPNMATMLSVYIYRCSEFVKTIKKMY